MKKISRTFVVFLGFMMMFAVSSYAQTYDNSYKMRIGLHYAGNAKTSYELIMNAPRLLDHSSVVVFSTLPSRKISYQSITLGNAYDSFEKAKFSAERNGGFVCYKDGSYYEAALASSSYWKVETAVVTEGSDHILFAFVPKKDLLLSSEDERFMLNKRNYRGELELLASNSKLTAINYIGLQDYLYGVVPKEIQYNWEMEALKAQAICSRNFSIKNKGKYAKHGFDLDTSTYSQVYGGLDAENERTNRAVDETLSKLGYYNDEIADLFFFAESGGRTESSENVWGMKRSYLIGVDDPYSLGGSYANWKFSISRSSLEGKMSKAGSSVGDIERISIDDRTENDRVKLITVHGSKGSRTFKREEFRRLIGNTQLKSMYFDIEVREGDKSSSELDDIFFELEQVVDGKKDITPAPERRGSGSKVGDTITFLGHGYGHGVGMSQYGAHKMAQQGRDYTQILAHYFKGVEVR
ncbi:SpoIID/LytB domain-containing protein [Filifactor villosus]|uniref:SpoIID/LytB domain-containing protein n=1 Tax=Filifactor villosus TaxID=29374 RepID=A0ABV9QMG7_9FIRM